MKTKVNKIDVSKVRDLFVPLKKEFLREGFSLEIRKIDDSLLSIPSAITNRFFLTVWIDLYKTEDNYLIKNKKYMISYSAPTYDTLTLELENGINKIYEDIWVKIMEYKLMNDE